jgi:hypothetical protein
MAFSTEIHENRAFAAEIKFLVPAGRVEELRAWARNRLGPDPYGGGPHGDTYETNSLYFDTPDFDVFHRRGSYGRSKYRVRRYGQSGNVFCERKLKTRDLVSKRRSIVDIHDVLRLAHRDPRKGWAGHWFHRRILARDLAVVCQIAYRRTALVHCNGDGPIRLTLDEHIHAEPASELAFHNLPPGNLLTGGAAVLELKYYQALPATFQQLIAEFSLTAQPISKYRMSVAALRLAETAKAIGVTI